ncbi:MAG TPA: lamin tail domain-containing protein [Bacilli bacterium]|nr:lamin tail domain-containing protein [Bacilli bacterium]
MGTKFKKGFFLFASAMLLFGAGFSFLRANDSGVVGVKAATTTEVVQFGSGKTNNWATSYQNLGSDYIGIATLSHYASATSANLFGEGNVLASDLVVEFKIGTYGGSGQQGVFKVELLDSQNNVLSSQIGNTNLSSSTESYAQGPTITVVKPANPENISSIKVALDSVGTITTSKYVRLQELSISFETGSGSSVALTSIAVTNEPTKKAYFDGEDFDPAGLQVTAYFDDSSSNDVTGLVTITPSSLSTGVTSLTVSYSFGGVEKTTTITGITVEAIVLNSIEIKTPATKTTFGLGESFSYTGLSITANYNNESVDLTSGFTVTGVNSGVIGNQSATISFGGKTATYQVKVTNENADVGDVLNSSEIFISEYIEASSGNDKLVEIFNGTGSSIDLQDYSIKEFANGANTASYTYTFTEETILLNGETFCFVNKDATSAYKVGKYVETSITYFNGNDAVGLYKNDTLIDVIGVIGQDPGTEWTGTDADGNAGSTKDMTLRRAPSITSPNTTFSMGEWVAIANQQSDNVGTHTFASHDVTALEQATAFADYVMTGIGSNAAGSCQTVYPLLQTEYNYMVEDSQTIFETSSDTLFVNARARMDLIEAYVATNGSSTMEPTEDKSGNSLQNIVLIGSLGLTALVGFYILNKKKEA